MSFTQWAAGAAVRTAEAVSPAYGAAVALPLFGHVARPRPVHPDDQPTMDRARRSSLRIRGLDGRGVSVAVYEWGAGPDTVVVAHGWNGRASQFATLVRELVAEGFRVVAFDAPAHGWTSGRATYLVDWTDALSALADKHDGLRSVVGHSFGGLAALVAAAQGLQVGRVVTIAAPADADLLLTQFQSMLGYADRTGALLRDRFARRYFPGDADPFSRLSPLRQSMLSTVPLLAIHDEGDKVVPFAELARIAAVHPDARIVATRGYGHGRVLAADPVLDAVVEFVTEAGHPAEAARPGRPTTNST